MTTTNTTSRKNRRSLVESAEPAVVSAKDNLVEDVVFPSTPLQVEMVEDKSTGKKKWFLRGQFGQVDKATENKRVYSKGLIEREIKKLGPAMAERRCFGACDHPADGKASLRDVSHVITKLEIKDNGEVHGEAEILPTPNGAILKSLAEAGCGIGFSSRGFGTTKKNEAGDDHVQDDYRLVTFDAVADPASKTAYPNAFNEAKNAPALEGSLSEDALAQVVATQAMAEKLAKTESQLAAAESRLEEAADKIVATIEASKATIEASIRERLAADPKNAGNAGVAENILRALRPFLPENTTEGSAMAEKDTQITDLQKQVAALEAKLVEQSETADKLAAMAKKGAYAYHLERQIGADVNADLLRNAVGDVSVYENVGEIDAKVAAVQADLAKQAAAAEDERKKEEQRFEALKVENQKLQEALATSVALNKAQDVDAYLAERTRLHPKKASILEQAKATPPATRAEVDSLCDGFRVAMHESDQVEDIRGRVRTLLGQGVDTPAVVAAPRPSAATPAATGPQVTNEDFNGLGVSLTEIQQLSGLRN